MLIIQGFRLPVFSCCYNFKVFLMRLPVAGGRHGARIRWGGWMGLLVGLGWARGSPEPARLVASLALVPGVAFLFQLGLQPGAPILGLLLRVWRR